MFGLKLLYGVGILSVYAVAQDASTWGPTVDPDYTRQEGKSMKMSIIFINQTILFEHVLYTQESIECPNTHPYALNNGQSCCSKLVRAAGCAETGILKFEDASSCCASSDTLACPANVEETTGVCKSMKLSKAINIPVIRLDVCNCLMF